MRTTLRFLGEPVHLAYRETSTRSFKVQDVIPEPESPMTPDKLGMPPLEQLVVRHSDLQEVVLPHLLGTVFHVTSEQGFEGIMSSGCICSNQDERLRFTFPQSKNNYGRQRGYVCLFDLRDVEEDKLEDALRKFYFIRPTDAQPVFLLLRPSEYAKLIPWTVAATGAMVIPYVEAWYPEDLPVSALSGGLSVTVIIDDADSSYRGVMRRLLRDEDQLLDTGLVNIEARSVAELRSRAVEWTRIAEEAGLQVDQGWEETHVKSSASGYLISVHASAPASRHQR